MTAPIVSIDEPDSVAIPVQQTAIELFDELELPISSTVWGVTSIEYINGTDKVNPNIPKLQPLTLVPTLGDSAAQSLPYRGVARTDS